MLVPALTIPIERGPNHEHEAYGRRQCEKHRDENLMQHGPAAQNGEEQDRIVAGTSCGVDPHV